VKIGPVLPGVALDRWDGQILHASLIGNPDRPRFQDNRGGERDAICQRQEFVMSILVRPGDDARYSTRGGVYVPAGEGITKWFSGDIYTVKLRAEATNGVISVVDASIPVGSGPVPHSHVDEDETFFMLSGELEFLDGDMTFMAGPGDLVFVPRKTRHRFKNIGLHPARMLFLYTPGATADIFVEGGDEPEPGKMAQPWGPERIDARILGLFDKYGTVAG
jgi:mannose-6-phosphate isomerase-like protein (cupin superfamily)